MDKLESPGDKENTEKARAAKPGGSGKTKSSEEKVRKGKGGRPASKTGDAGTAAEELTQDAKVKSGKSGKKTRDKGPDSSMGDNTEPDESADGDDNKTYDTKKAGNEATAGDNSVSHKAGAGNIPTTIYRGLKPVDRPNPSKGAYSTTDRPEKLSPLAEFQKARALGKINDNPECELGCEYCTPDLYHAPSIGRRFAYKDNEYHEDESMDSAEAAKFHAHAHHHRHHHHIGGSKMPTAADSPTGKETDNVAAADSPCIDGEDADSLAMVTGRVGSPMHGGSLPANQTATADSDSPVDEYGMPMQGRYAAGSFIQGAHIGSPTAPVNFADSQGATGSPVGMGYAPSPGGGEHADSCTYNGEEGSFMEGEGAGSPMTGKYYANSPVNTTATGDSPAETNSPMQGAPFQEGHAGSPMQGAPIQGGQAMQGAPFQGGYPAQTGSPMQGAPIQGGQAGLPMQGAPIQGGQAGSLMQGRPFQEGQAGIQGGSPMQGAPIQGGQAGSPMQGVPFQGGQAGSPTQGTPFQGGQAGSPMQGAPTQGGQAGFPMHGAPAQGEFAGSPMQGGCVGSRGQAGSPIQGGQAGSPIQGGQAGSPMQGGRVGSPLQATPMQGGQPCSPMQGGRVGGSPMQGGHPAGALIPGGVTVQGGKDGTPMQIYMQQTATLGSPAPNTGTPADMDTSLLPAENAVLQATTTTTPMVVHTAIGMSAEGSNKIKFQFQSRAQIVNRPKEGDGIQPLPVTQADQTVTEGQNVRTFTEMRFISGTPSAPDDEGDAPLALLPPEVDSTQPTQAQGKIGQVQPPSEAPKQ